MYAKSWTPHLIIFYSVQDVVFVSTNTATGLLSSEFIGSAMLVLLAFSTLFAVSAR